MNDISVAFLGSHPLAEWCLEYLTDHRDIQVEIVVTYLPEKETWWEGNLYETANDLNHNVVPLSEEEKVLDHDVDYLLSVLYPDILGQMMLEHPHEKALNLHQAELPRYRGSNAFVHSILNARQDDYWKHGTTLHVMAEDVDAGDIVDRRFEEIKETDTGWSLYQRVREESLEMFQDNVPRLINRDIDDVLTPQSEFDGPRYFHRRSSVEDIKKLPLDEVRKEDVRVYDYIRALDFPPHEPAYTEIQGRKVYLTLTGYQEL